MHSAIGFVDGQSCSLLGQVWHLDRNLNALILHNYEHVVFQVEIDEIVNGMTNIKSHAAQFSLIVREGRGRPRRHSREKRVHSYVWHRKCVTGGKVWLSDFSYCNHAASAWGGMPLYEKVWLTDSKCGTTQRGRQNYTYAANVEGKAAVLGLRDVSSRNKILAEPCIFTSSICCLVLFI